MSTRICEHVRAHPRKALAVRVESPLGSVRLCSACAARWLGITKKLVVQRIKVFDDHVERVSE